MQLLTLITVVRSATHCTVQKSDGNYQVKDPEKLIRIAKEWGVETEGKDIYDLAHEMAEIGLMEYGKPFGYQRFLDRMPAGQKEKLIENEIAPRAIDREVSTSCIWLIWDVLLFRKHL